MRENALIVDARGLVCPYVAIKTKIALRTAPPGSSVVVLCDDPMAGIDLPVLAHQLGHSAIINRQVDDYFEVVIEVRTMSDRFDDVWPILDP